MSEEQYVLPEDWKWADLPEVASIIMGQSPPGSTYNAHGRGLPFYQGKADFGELHPSPRVWCDEPRKVAEPGDILLSVRAPVGPTNIADSECAIGRGLCVIRPRNGMPSRYLREYLMLIEEQVAEMGKGSTFKAIGRADLDAIRVPVAPPAEQHRIVEKIERLFAESRTARQALARVPALLKRFRQAVLAKAFRGELTERDPDDEPAAVSLERIRAERRRKWEEDLLAKGKESRKAKYVEPKPPDTSELPEVPKGWAWATVEQFAEVRLGRQRSPARATGPNMRPYMRAANVTWHGLDLSDVKEMDFSPEEQEVYVLRRGDVLLSEASGSISEVGKPAVWHEEIPGCCFQNTLIRVRSDDPLPNYLHFHFLNDALTARFRRVAKGIGINHLGALGLSRWVVSVPPHAEQHRIVSKIEGLFGQADAIERAVIMARRRAEQVDQAILARAFRGEM